jgi:hypothetical protein
MGVFMFGEFGRNLANRSNQFAATVNHRFEFQKRCQLFIGTHNELAPNGDARAGALWGEFARQSAKIR